MARAFGRHPRTERNVSSLLGNLDPTFDTRNVFADGARSLSMVSDILMRCAWVNRTLLSHVLRPCILHPQRRRTTCE
jgi:hypothetical protein